MRPRRGLQGRCVHPRSGVCGTGRTARPGLGCRIGAAEPPATHARHLPYVRFPLSNTSFPWRHDTIGTAEDMGIFFGSLCVLC